MIINGIIAEYNPFHNGHSYQMQDALKQTGADYTIVVMSGNFMQRGAPAIINKYKRAEMALLNGADLVLELPAVYSASSAEFFATGAFTLMDKLGVADYLCFGSECGNLTTLGKIADILLEEPEDYVVLLKQFLKNGYTYPNARNNALMLFCPELCKDLNVLSYPNNILGIEYLKAIRRRKSSIKPITTLRGSSGYHDRMLNINQSSALALRQAINDHENLTMLSSQMPKSAYEVLTSALEQKRPLNSNDLSAAMHYKLLIDEEKGYTDYLDVSQELSDRIQKHLYDYKEFRSFCDLLKTKNMTYTRISRCLLHILLNIKDEDVETYRLADYIKYAKVLGFKKDSEALLSAIKNNADIPLLTKLADAESLLDDTGIRMLRKEIQINNIYEGISAIKSGSSMINEYSNPIVVIK